MANELYLYDEIGPSRWGLIDAKTVIDALGEFAGADVTIRFNTPGGSVFEAQSIAAAICRYEGRTTGVVDGIAASSGSYILQACDVRQMNAGTHQMVHGPWTIVGGNKIVLRETADKLEMLEASISELYAQRWQGDDNQLSEALESEETWYTAAEALEIGLADEILEAPAIAAAIPDGLFAKIPKAVERDPRAARLREKLAARKVAGDISLRRDHYAVTASRLTKPPAAT